MLIFSHMKVINKEKCPMRLQLNTDAHRRRHKCVIMANGNSKKNICLSLVKIEKKYSSNVFDNCEAF